MTHRAVCPEYAHDDMCWRITAAFSMTPSSMSIEDRRGFVTPGHIVRWLAERVPMADGPARDLRESTRAQVIREIANVLGCNARELAPTTRLEDLVPQEPRRAVWPELTTQLGVSQLDLPRWIEQTRVVAAALLALGPIVAVNIFGLVEISGWVLAAEVAVLFLVAYALYALLGLVLLSFRVEIPADATDIDTLTTHWILDGRVALANDDAWTRAELSEIVRSIVACSYALDPGDVHPDTPLRQC